MLILSTSNYHKFKLNILLLCHVDDVLIWSCTHRQLILFFTRFLCDESTKISSNWQINVRQQERSYFQYSILQKLIPFKKAISPEYTLSLRFCCSLYQTSQHRYCIPHYFPRFPKPIISSTVLSFIGSGGCDGISNSNPNRRHRTIKKLFSKSHYTQKPFVYIDPIHPQMLMLF